MAKRHPKSRTSASRPPTLLSAELAEAMSHSTRVYAMCVLSGRTACPREIAEELEEATKNVAYHFEILVRLNCIEHVCDKPAQGGRVVEHYYRAKVRPYLDDPAWDELSESVKWQVVVPILRLISKDLNESMAAGVFLDPDDNHLSRNPMVVDAEGWKETKELLDETSDKLLKIQAKNGERQQKRDPNSPNEMMAIKVAIMQFRSPDKEPPG